VDAVRKQGQKRQLKIGPPTIMEGDQYGQLGRDSAFVLGG
ncbi:hypothetical protein ABIB56_003771, partial [Glaciihabitans sp. UYNi722]